jgi:hypothetical protein
MLSSFRDLLQVSGFIDIPVSFTILNHGLKLTELDGSLPILQFCAFMKSNMAVAILLTWSY